MVSNMSAHILSGDSRKIICRSAVEPGIPLKNNPGSCNPHLKCKTSYPPGKQAIFRKSSTL